MAQRSRIHVLLLLILLAGSLTLACQRWWVRRLYQESQSGRREVFQKQFCRIVFPPPYTSWQQVGAIRVNIRIATVYLAGICSSID